jgi:hypothetical protein
VNAKLWIQIVIGTVGYGAWACMAYGDRSLLPDFLKFNIAMAIGTIGLALRDMPAAGPSSISPMSSATAAPPVDMRPGSQTGYAKPVLLALVALGLALPILIAHLDPKPQYAIPPILCNAQPGNDRCH